MDYEEHEHDRTIEPSQLDVEACQQADLFFKWAERYVQAQGAADDLKAEAEHYLARIRMDCRSNPEKFGLEKVTENAVEAATLCNEKYNLKLQKWREAFKEAMLLRRAMEAIDDKKRMIEILTTLHGQEYFAGPSVPRNLAEAWMNHKKQNAEDVITLQRAAARQRVRRDET